MQTEFIFDEPILRSLIAEASSIFKSVQEVPANSRTEYLKLSRTYRSTVRACLEKLQDSLSPSDADGNEMSSVVIDENKRTMAENNITIFYSVECVWHLCEILLIDRSPAQVVVPQLLEWIRFHFPAYERRAADLLFADIDDMEDVQADILPVVRGLITQGLVDVARTLLRQHPSADSTAFQIADEVLKAMPVYNVSVIHICKVLKYIFNNYFIVDLRWIIGAEVQVSMAILGDRYGIESINWLLGCRARIRRYH